MESSFNKWGKQIEYSITPETMSLVVKENQDTWIYITKRDFNDKVLSSTISSAGVRPEFIKKREILNIWAIPGTVPGTRYPGTSENREFRRPGM